MKNQAPKALDKIERNKLLREVDRSGNNRDYAIILTLLMTGIRVSELVALDKTDVEIRDLGEELRVRNKERTIPLNSEVRKAIKQY